MVSCLWISAAIDLKHKQELAVDTKTATRPASRHPRGALVTEGKTKKIYQAADGSDLVTVDIKG